MQRPLPLITISMPVYQVEPYVERALCAVLDQDYPNIEVLVVDDKGQDRSMEIIQALQTNHPRGKSIRVIDHGYNQGTGTARNSGIDQAKGDYLFFMDSDDCIPSSCISTLYAAMKETPVDFVAGSLVEVNADNHPIRERRFPDMTLTNNDEILRFQYDAQWIKAHHSQNLMAPVWNRLYDIRFLRENQIRCIPGQKIEDLAFTFTLFMKAHSLRTIPDITYLYNLGRNLSTTKFIKHYTEDILREDLLILQSYSQYIPKLRKRDFAVYSAVYAFILIKASRTLYLTRHLHLTRERSQSLRQQIRSQVSIHWREIPKTKSACYFWLYLCAPACFQGILDCLFFKRKEKNGSL